MKIGDCIQLYRSGIKSGSRIWACAFKITENKEKLRYIQRPIEGVLVVGRNEKEHQRIIKERQSPDYFVPFKKNSTELDWRKVVKTSARIFATTKKECIEMYNREILCYIEDYKAKINNLQRELM